MDSKNKQIVILGAGAMGSSIGGLLAAKNEVLLVGRAAHVTEIKKNGLRLTGKIKKTVFVTAATAIKDIPPHTILFITTKTHKIKTALTPELRKKIKKDTVIVYMQNGIGADDIIKKIVHCRVARIVTLMGAIFLQPGVVEVKSLLQTYIADTDNDITTLLSEAGFKCISTKNIQNEIWKKLVINCVINGLGSLLQVKNNQLTGPYLAKTKHAIIAECVAVAEKEQISLPDGLFTQIEQVVKHSPNINSTLQDLMQHKTTEIDFINGAIVRLGKKHGIPTPVNETIYNMIKTLESL